MASFTDWQFWEHSPELCFESLRETLDGGQTFRWNWTGDYFEGRWGHNSVRIRIKDERLQYAVPQSVDPAQTVSELANYFGGNRDFEALTDALPWRNDPILKTAINAFPGLRILRQPFAETLFCFLCSSTKQIPQIKAICEAVAADMGSPLPDGSHALPTWAQIAAGGEARLRAAKLGYRARYIDQTAQFLSDKPGWLETVEHMPTDEARAQLLQLPGVGRKIADCVLLFGAGRLESFPIDTWVQKILVRAYGLDDWSLPQLQQFARIHFGESAGYAQQYLFAAARADLINS